MDIESLESKLGVSFRDRVLLRLALTHSSYLNENRSNPETSNERLEFLGDAVIGVAIADELYRSIWAAICPWDGAKRRAVVENARITWPPRWKP